MKKPIFSPTIALWIILATMLTCMVYYHPWTRSKRGERGVIKWDVISYYAYLPATFIYGDVQLGFLDHPPEGFKNDNKFWYYTLDNGNRLIQTSMGLSILYSPFFFMADMLAPIFEQTPDGFSSIYQLFLVLSSLFYVITGLLILKRILLKFFSPKATAFTLLLIGLGTNLFFYTVHEGAMSHGYNFALITLFLYLVIRWYEEPSTRKSILMGLVYGLIVLVRPSNIIIGILFLGWGVSGWDALRRRSVLLLKQYKLLLLMMIFFLIPWIPQMLYWKAITGSLLFNSYGPSGSSFYFGSPHISHLLFSFRKGWYLYTPVMLAATFGILFLGKRCKGGIWPISVLLAVQIYLLASWWSWWNGGSFGLRSFVDIYGVMALPLAALVDASLKSRKFVGIATTATLGFFLYMNQFQSFQYKKSMIHYTGMTKEAYRLNFLKFKSDGAYWKMLSIPDSELARLGIYVNYYSGEDYSSLKEMEREEGVELIRSEIQQNDKVRKEIGKHAKRSGESYDEVFDMVVERVYEYKVSH